jgi:hypothetical protein
VLLFLVIAAVLGFGGTTLFRYGIEQQQAEATARAAQISTQNAEVLAAQTASAAEEQSAATATAGALAAASPTAVAEAELGTGTAIASGNLRSEPVITPETVIGQVCAGDQLAFLERRQVAEATWYRIRVTATGPDCDPQRVTIGSSGWASSILTGEPLP